MYYPNSTYVGALAAYLLRSISPSVRVKSERLGLVRIGLRLGWVRLGIWLALGLRSTLRVRVTAGIQIRATIRCTVINKVGVRFSFDTVGTRVGSRVATSVSLTSK